jgi:serine/threonine protein kinase
MPFLPPLELPGYILTGRIGSGAFAEVYRAQRREDGRAVAVKLPRVDALETFQPREFLQEAELWSRLKHPYIVSVQEWGLKPVPWIAMELMEGGSLRQRLSRLTARESLEIGVKLAEALYYAHHLGVIHRDIKPQNILFDRQNTPKLSDWGLGKVMLHASRSASGFKGTLAYAAPEQLSSDLGEPDWRTDIYQLAAVLYEMVTGQLPCGGEPGWILTREVRPPRQLNPALPARLDGILLKALDRRKERRYRDVSLLGEELERLLQQG